VDDEAFAKRIITQQRVVSTYSKTSRSSSYVALNIMNRNSYSVSSNLLPSHSMHIMNALPFLTGLPSRLFLFPPQQVLARGSSCR